ncbi:MAG: hypothetical protein AABX89_06415 [Candidatus Thermoplasmatota archaeon]
MEWSELVSPDVAERAKRALAGSDESRPLALGRLEAGQVGVVAATIVAIGLPRTFTRKRGGEGRLLRVMLRDATGEAALVLWDEETRHAVAWRMGQALRLLGASVKAGRDGPELGLGAARIEKVADAEPTVALEGRFIALSPDRATEAGLQAEAELAVAAGLATVVVAGATVPLLRGVAAGTRLVWATAKPHPVLEGWFIVPRDAMPNVG